MFGNCGQNRFLVQRYRMETNWNIIREYADRQRQNRQVVMTRETGDDWLKYYAYYEIYV